MSGITVFDGHPERNGVLVPHSDSGDLRRKEAVSQWRFEGSYPEGKYVSCDYAQGVLHLFARVDDAALDAWQRLRTRSPATP